MGEINSPAERQVTVSGDISGIVSAGDYAVNVQFRAGQMTVLPPEALVPTAEAAGPGRLMNVPSRAGLFVGREAELARLDAAMAGQSGLQVIHGLGGAGKSTLAAHWALTRATERSVTWWITADSPADVDAGLAGLGAALRPALAAVLPAGALRELAVQWLASHQNWLVVLDNVADPGAVASLLARTPLGRYLITSRRRRAGMTSRSRSGSASWTRSRLRTCSGSSPVLTDARNRMPTERCARSSDTCRWP